MAEAMDSSLDVGDEAFRKLCQHYSRGCSLVVSKRMMGREMSGGSLIKFRPRCLSALINELDVVCTCVGVEDCPNLSRYESTVCGL